MMRRYWFGGLATASTLFLMTGCRLMVEPDRQKGTVHPQVSPSVQAEPTEDEATSSSDNSGSVIVESKDNNNVRVTINGKTIYSKNGSGGVYVNGNHISVGSSGHGTMRSVTQTAIVADAASLKLHTDYGGISVTPSNNTNQFSITAQISLDDVRLTPAQQKKFLNGFTVTIDKDGDTMVPRVAAPAGFPQDMGYTVSFNASVPKHIALDLSSQSGDVWVKDTHTDAAITATSAYGNITVAHAGNEITAKSQIGDVTITSDPGTVNIEAHSDYGEISVSGDAQTVQTSTQNGDVTVKGAAHALWVQAETSYGEVHLEDCGGDVTGTSQNGDVSYAGTPKKIILQSSYGEVSATIESAAALTDVSLESSNGDIAIEVPGDARVAFDADTASGNIDLEHAPGSVEEDGSRQTYHESLNGGSRPVRLSTNYGDITVHVR